MGPSDGGLPGLHAVPVPVVWRQLEEKVVLASLGLEELFLSLQVILALMLSG